MIGVSHAIIGASKAVVFYTFMTESISPDIAIPILFGGAAALVPDIDTKHSTISVFASKRLNTRLSKSMFSRKARTRFPEFFIYTAISLVELFVGLVLSLFTNTFLIFSKHRGISHSLLPLFILSPLMFIVAAMLEISPLYPSVIFIGYLSHILADSTTISGVEIFSPISNKKFYLLPKPLRIRTGQDMLEFVIVAFVFFMSAISVYMRYG